MKNKTILNNLWVFDISKDSYPCLPEGYIQCKDINCFLSIDLRGQTITQIEGIEYIFKESDSYYTRMISARQVDKYSSNRISLLKKYIDQGSIFIKPIPLYITLQSNNEINKELFIKRFKDWLIKAKKENKIQIKEGIRAFDYQFNYSYYTIYVLKKTGKSNLIFHHIVEGVYNRTKDDIMYVIEHILSAAKC